MILYHFTSLFHLPGILGEGEINRGDVPISKTQGLRSPWFTRDGSEEGTLVASNVNKSGVRITVAFNDRDPNLFKWTDLVEQWRISKAWVETLHKTGGEGSDNWFIYRGNVPSSMWTEVAVLTETGDYLPISARALHYTGVVPNFTEQVRQRDIA